MPYTKTRWNELRKRHYLGDCPQVYDEWLHELEPLDKTMTNDQVGKSIDKLRPFAKEIIWLIMSNNKWTNLSAHNYWQLLMKNIKL